MSFTQLCTGAIITILILVVTLLLGLFFGWINNDDDMGIYMSWFLTSIGFGICLTMLLFQNGII